MTRPFALTIHQPWASLIACGAKTIETRGWFPPNGWTGELLIHAAKHYATGSTKAARAEFEETCLRQPFLDRLLEAGYRSSNDLPRAAIIAVAQLKRVAPMTAEGIATLAATKPDEYAFGFYEVGRYAWVLESVQRLREPVPARGMQKLWRPPDDVITAVGADRWDGIVA